MMKVCFVAFLFNVAVSTADQYVWDLLKPPQDTATIIKLMKNAQPGVTYPINNVIPHTTFVCDKPGFYSDTETKCQVFHR